MGCFLACFGFSKKKKRRKPSNKVSAGDLKRGSYVPLDSSLKIIGVDAANECANREKPKEQIRLKTRKKVSFNLNVQTYEPISTDYHFFECGEEEEIEKKGSKRSLPTSSAKMDSTTLKMGLFPSNHRYQNVRDSYDEEDYLEELESDLDDDDDDQENDFDSDTDDPRRISQEEFSKRFCSSLSTNGELEYPNARDNIHNVHHSVLSPIENLTQWKAAKAKVASPKQQKENMALSEDLRMRYCRSNSNQSQPKLQEIVVHASLSSWLNSQSTN